jgi:hypothetical protein
MLSVIILSVVMLSVVAPLAVTPGDGFDLAQAGFDKPSEAGKETKV